MCTDEGLVAGTGSTTPRCTWCHYTSDIHWLGMCYWHWCYQSCEPRAGDICHWCKSHINK